MNFIAELKRRNVHRVAAFYAANTWTAVASPAQRGKLPGGLMGVLFARKSNRSGAPPSAFGTFPRCTVEGKIAA
jgi:hypothetical protein